MTHMQNFASLQEHMLPMPVSLLSDMPASQKQLDFVVQSRSTISRSLHLPNSPLLLVLGPCSIHDITAAKEYANHLTELVQECQDTFLFAMRTYFEKPRTATGWRGIIHDPHLDGSYDISTGIKLTRQLLLDLADMQIAAACEILDPLYLPYLQDLISWGCIGARTSESQVHRQIASGLPMPIAFKNNVEGSLTPAIYGTMVAKEPQTYLNVDKSGRLSLYKSSGNKDAHICLRGGKKGPNFDEDSVEEAIKLLKNNNLQEQLIIDCSHGNSNKNPERQIDIFNNVIEQIANGNTCIKGIILESNLHEGKQDIGQQPLKYGVSITDPCIDWQTTKTLVYAAREKLRANIFTAEATSEIHA